MSKDRQLSIVASTLIGLGLCGFLFSFALSFQSLGMGQGLEIGDTELAKIQYGEGKNPFGYSVQNTHQRMASDYGTISLSFLVIAVLTAAQFLFGQLRRVVFPLLFIASAAIAANFLRVLIRDKAGVDDSFYEAPRNHFVNLTIAYDWFLLIIIAAVVIGSLFMIIRVGRKPVTI